MSEDTIDMAREAGADIGTSGRWLMTPSELDRFVALVRADEREACAKVCEDYTDNDGGTFIDHEGHGYSCATAIRARSGDQK